MHPFYGRHAFGEMSGIDPERLADPKGLEQILTDAIEPSGATLCGMQSKRFEPEGGVTVLALLAESHASIHTYPEYGTLFIDAFTCGDCDPMKIIEVVADRLSPAHQTINVIERGVPR